jgi:HD-like signal output (HDOD) protein
VFDLEKVLRATDELEPLPPTVARLAALIADPEIETREIVEIVAFDPALTGALLRCANSAASAATTQIVTIRNAVVRLGRASVLSHCAESMVLSGR